MMRRSKDYLYTFRSALRGMLLTGGAMFGLFLFTMIPAYADNAKEAIGEAEEEDAGLRHIERLREDRVSNTGQVLGSVLNAWKEAQNLPNNNTTAFWEPLGPASLGSPPTGATRSGGRTNAIAVDPTNPDVIFLGAALGGV